MMRSKLMQAYKLVPWRSQLQWLGISLLSLVLVSLVAWLYLTISAKASIAGRDIQEYQYQKTKSEQAIAALETDLAVATSYTNMLTRAKQLGFKEVNPGKNEYMIIPGYGGKPSARLAPQTLTIQTHSDVMSPEFTQSLWDWVYLSYVEPAIEP